MDDSELRQWVKKTFNTAPQQLRLYREALTPRQYERLEFFGDSVLGFIVSEHLIQHYPFMDEPGWFTQVKADIVQNETLIQIAEKLQLKAALQGPEGWDSTQASPRVLGDMLEALLGAIYLDRGLKACKDAIEKVFQLEQRVLQAADPQGPIVTNPQRARYQFEQRCKTKELETLTNLKHKNVIAGLQEFLTKKGEAPPKYREIERTGSGHQPMFVLEAVCRFQGRTHTVESQGGNLKSARETAARQLLEKLVLCYQQRWQPR